jgi:hypothetical protein
VFDHVTLRVADLAVVSSAFTAALDELEIEQTSSTPRFSAWGNFALTQTDADHPIAHRAHLALIAPTPAHVDRFARAGIDAGFADDGPAGPRPQYANDYYAAFLKDRTRPRPDTAATASRVSALATTRATTPHSCSTPTATTSKSSTITARRSP